MALKLPRSSFCLYSGIFNQGGRFKFHEIDISGHNLQIDRFGIVLLGRDNLIDVGELLALGVNFEVVGVAFPAQASQGCPNL